MKASRAFFGSARGAAKPKRTPPRTRELPAAAAANAGAPSCYGCLACMRACLLARKHACALAKWGTAPQPLWRQVGSSAARRPLHCTWCCLSASRSRRSCRGRRRFGPSRDCELRGRDLVQLAQGFRPAAASQCNALLLRCTAVNCPAAASSVDRRYAAMTHRTYRNPRVCFLNCCELCEPPLLRP